MAENIHVLVGRRVREERKRAGLTIERLAERVGITPSFLSYIERHGRKASLDTIQKLAEALRVPISELFKDVPGPGRDAVYDASRRFGQLVRDKTSQEMEALLGALKALDKTLGRPRR